MTQAEKRTCARCGHEVPDCSKCGRQNGILGGSISRPGLPTRELCHTVVDRSKGGRTCYEWEAGRS